MVLAIVGSRKWSDSATLYAEADKLQPTAIVSGGAVGADFIAEKYAADRGLPLIFPCPGYEPQTTFFQGPLVPIHI
jgi:predicted Rossmann fold nucleotide-binding protein DprA/Smf involved in DNA uptake